MVQRNRSKCSKSGRGGGDTPTLAHDRPLRLRKRPDGHQGAIGRLGSISCDCIGQ